MRCKAALVMLLVLSASSAFAAVEVTFSGGRTLRVERLEYEDDLAVLTLPGGGTIAVEASRIRLALDLPDPPPVPQPVPSPPAPASPALQDPPPASVPAAPGPPSEIDLARLVREAAARHGLDPELLRCLIEIESGGDPRAVSPKGALGLGQLMPGTAEELGVKDPFDPVQAADAAARHLKDLLDRSGGRFVPALAAYNAGQGAVKRYGGLPPYQETIRYIERILRIYASE